MAVPAPAIPLLVRLGDGRNWGAVEFPGGFVCVYHPDEPTVCTIALPVEHLLAGREAGDPLRGATVEDYGSR